MLKNYLVLLHPIQPYMSSCYVSAYACVKDAVLLYKQAYSVELFQSDILI